MADAQKVTLGEVLSIKHGYAFKGEFFVDVGERIVLTPGNFRREGGLQIRPEKERYYSGDFPQEFLLLKGELLVAMTDLTQGAPLLGAPLSVPESARFLHNQRLGKVIIRDDVRLDIGFAYYLFCNDTVRAEIRAGATGSTVRHTSPGRICAVSVTLPHLVTQRRIAAVLSAYDDLIENNARRIRVLEEMARAVNREWFVHYRYPGHTGTKLPEGWTRTTLGALVSIEKDSLDPRDTPDTEFDLHSFEACDLGRLPIPTMGTAIQSNKFRVPEDVVLLPKLNPHIPRVWMPFLEGDRPAICSTEFLVLKPRAGIPRTYVYAMVEGANFAAGLAQRADGTSNSHKRLKPDDVMNRPVVEPSPELLARFDEVASAQLRAVHTLRKRNRALRAARDLLLPKLLSGELSVERIPDPAEAAE